jgi:endonuclease-3
MRWTRKAIRAVIEDLEAIYGTPVYSPRYEPLDELVSCILSQHSTDATSFPTFDRLRAAHPEWGQIAAMSEAELAEWIRPAGLANQKARAILATLMEISKRTGEYSLDHLRTMKMEQANEWLMSLPGVGPKTAAIVLCFAFGLPAIPVDTHIFRVGWRLGLYPKRIGEAKAHCVVRQLVPEDLAFRFHVALIQHGRRICRSRRPACDQCPLNKRCDFSQGRLEVNP